MTSGLLGSLAGSIKWGLLLDDCPRVHAACGVQNLRIGHLQACRHLGFRVGATENSQRGLELLDLSLYASKKIPSGCADQSVGAKGECHCVWRLAVG